MSEPIDDFRNAAEAAQRQYAKAKVELKQVMQQALPEIEALQNPTAQFSTSLMALMHARNADAMDPRTYEVVGSVIQVFRELDSAMLALAVQLRSPDQVTDVEEATETARKMTAAFERCSEDLGAVMPG